MTKKGGDKGKKRSEAIETRSIFTYPFWYICPHNQMILTMNRQELANKICSKVKENEYKNDNLGYGLYKVVLPSTDKTGIDELIEVLIEDKDDEYG